MSFVKQIRLTAAQFTAQNPTLDDSTEGFEIDTLKFKKGDGSTTWANLLYADPTAVITALALKADSLTAADATARLALTGLTRGARVYQTDNGFWYELTNAAAPSDAASWQGIPKKYVALLTQTGTSNPVATVLENSLGGTVVWTRDALGVYLGTLVGAFPANKTILQALTGGADDGTPMNFLAGERLTDDVARLVCKITPIGADPNYELIELSDVVRPSTGIIISVYP